MPLKLCAKLKINRFLNKAHQLLGFPIEVVSGREEARLIYQGVSHFLPQTDETRLVIDIGGRSTEFILGIQQDASKLESYRLGSVSTSLKYFANGELTAAAFHKAEVAAKAVLEEAGELFPRHAWDTAYGSSGTVSAVAEVLGSSGWSDKTITLEALDWLKRHLIRVGHVDHLRMEGLKEDRRAVIGGGLAVLYAVMELFDIEELQVTPGALRHGLLYDLIEREDDTKDTRAVTVAGLQKAFQADVEQAKRVSKVACYFLNQLQSSKAADLDWSRLMKKLDWAAQLHEIGAQISHTDSHKHSAYILDNTDAPGFAMNELHRLSLLVLGHKGKLKKLEIDFNDEGFAYQLICLRLAVIVCHARREPDYKKLLLKISEKQSNRIELWMEPLWSQRFPQSQHLLQQEIIAWQKTSWELQIKQH